MPVPQESPVDDPAEREGVVHLDLASRIREVETWPWSDPPQLGSPFAALFTADDGGVVEECAQRSWVSVSEHLLRLLSGPLVRVWVAPLDAGVRLSLRDVTPLAALAEFGERRRRMQALSELAGALARELSDPMAVASAKLEVLQLESDDPESLQRDLAVALEHVRRVIATLHTLRTVGRTPGPSMNPIRLAAALDEALVRLGSRRRSVRVHLDLPDLEVGCDGEIVANVCASLLRRSLDVLGPVQMAVTARRTGQGTVVVRIGPESSTSWSVHRLLDDSPLDRTLLASVGGGLSAARVAGADLLEVVLPQPVSLPKGVKPPTRTLLVVGDLVAPHVSRLLAHDGYSFVSVRTAADAVPQLPSCDGLVVELVLDGLFSGRHLARLARLRHSIPVVLVADGELPESAIPEGVAGVRWPATRDALLAALGHGRR
jgi:hypothetical protein